MKNKNVFMVSSNRANNMGFVNILTKKAVTVTKVKIQ